MAPPPPFSEIYKVVDGSEVDVDIYLPRPGDKELPKRPVAIDIHGGGWTEGASDAVNKDQIADCLARGWIVLAPNHRLCPAVDMLEGPMKDCRDLLAWVYDGQLEKVLAKRSTGDGNPHTLDYDHVFAFGHSSGAMLALALGFDVPRRPAGIATFSAPCNFASLFWHTPPSESVISLPQEYLQNVELLNCVYEERPVPTRTHGSLLDREQQPDPSQPDMNYARQAFLTLQMTRGNLLSTVFPRKDWALVDPLLNVTADFPPTFIVQGAEDPLVPVEQGRELLDALKKNGVKCGTVELPGEGHIYPRTMELGSATWNLQREAFDFLEACIKRA